MRITVKKHIILFGRIETLIELKLFKEAEDYFQALKLINEVPYCIDFKLRPQAQQESLNIATDTIDRLDKLLESKYGDTITIAS